MTREEQIKQAALEFENSPGDFDINTIADFFRCGAMWADKNPRVSLWDRDKVIDFLEYNLDDCKIIEDLIRAMGGFNREKLNEMVANAPDRRLEREKKKWIEKAEKWLLNNLPKTIEGYDRYFPRIDFIEYFKKAMEE